MAVPSIQPSFAKGEISPGLWGHVDLASWRSSCSTVRNMFVHYRGGLYSRGGAKFVGRSGQGAGTVKPRIIQWQFNNEQGYVLEWGENYVRFIFQGAYVVETPISVTAISMVNPCLVTTASPHGYSVGEW